jgi:hypothetical protein
VLSTDDDDDDNDNNNTFTVYALLVSVFRS